MFLEAVDQIRRRRPSAGPISWLLSGVRTDGTSTYLDGLRGIAVLYVILGHFIIYDPTGLAQKFIGSAAVYGVYLFFLLSSFLLTGILVKALRQRGVASAIIPYFRKRVLRIYPMFTVVLIALYLTPSYYLAMFAGQHPPWYEQFFLIETRSILWAISVEFEFYLALPIIALLFVYGNHRAKIALLFVLLTAVAAQWMHRTYNPGMFPNGYPHLLPYLFIFLLGSSIAIGKILVENGELPRPAVWLANAALIGGIIGQLWCLPGIGGLTLDDLASNRWHLLAHDQGGNTVLWGCVFFGLIFGSEAPRRLLASPVLRWVGVVSYSAYLTHILVFREIAPPMLEPAGFYWTGAACLVTTLLISTLTFIAIERPFMRMR